VFTAVPMRGNPVAVVLGADGLEAQAMQNVARWTNLSETTFVLAPTAAGADYRLRIFTPRMELPFAGHPTIGSAHAVLEAGVAKAAAGRMVQECGAGLIELAVEGSLLWLKAPRAQVRELDRRYLDPLAQALGAKIAGTPCAVSVGPVWLVADLGSSAAVDALAPRLEKIAGMSEALSVTGITVFGAASGEAQLHVRSFAPAQGIPEDPVCGSGNVSVAAYLARTGNPFGTSYAARQGMQLGRDGRVSIRIAGEDIFLGGNAVTCVEGTLRAA